MANEKRLIDANALKDRFKLRLDWLNLDVHDEYTKGLYHGCDYDMELIDEQPTVDAVEVVHGRWETANDGTHFCSQCGCDAPYTWDGIDRNFINSADDVPDRPSNYCPNCGAKMDGGQDKG